MSLEFHRDARRLLNEQSWRSATNRSYYSVYAALCDSIVPRHGGLFGRSRGNPGHEEIRKYIDRRHFPGHRPDQWRAFQESQELLGIYRVDADYRPHLEIDEVTARSCFHESVSVLNSLGVI